MFYLGHLSPQELKNNQRDSDIDNPPTNSEHEALIDNSAKIAGSINSMLEQDTPGEKGSLAKGESSDFPKMSNMHDMRGPSASDDAKLFVNDIISRYKQYFKFSRHKSRHV